MYQFIWLDFFFNLGLAPSALPLKMLIAKVIMIITGVNLGLCDADFLQAA